MPIEGNHPRFEQLVDLRQEIEILATGLGGPAGPAEGPVWWPEGGYLLFSDMGNDRRLKWTPGEGTSVMREPTNLGNGMTRDPQGRLVVCEQGARRVTREEPNGDVTVVADGYRGEPLNYPNDVVVASDGSIYFTDPAGRPSGVYRVSPDLTSIDRLTSDLALPNGLAFSPDESVLYVDDTAHGHIHAFDIELGRAPAEGGGRVFATLPGGRDAGVDGLKVDSDGNVYCAGAGGIWVFDDEGAHLGTITTGVATTNLAWGGDDWSTLYFTTFESLGRIRLDICGIPVPRRRHR